MRRFIKLTYKKNVASNRNYAGAIRIEEEPVLMNVYFDPEEISRVNFWAEDQTTKLSFKGYNDFYSVQESVEHVLWMLQDARFNSIEDIKKHKEANKGN